MAERAVAAEAAGVRSEAEYLSLAAAMEAHPEEWARFFEWLWRPDSRPDPIEHAGYDSDWMPPRTLARYRELVAQEGGPDPVV